MNCYGNVAPSSIGHHDNCLTVKLGPSPLRQEPKVTQVFDYHQA